MQKPVKTTHKGYDYLDWTGSVYHPGVDHNWGSTPDADLGLPVYPYRSGSVIFTHTSNDGFGNQVIVKHRDGLYSRYAHLNSIDVKVGQWLNWNEQLGTLGTTGASTSPHLHFSIFDGYILAKGYHYYPNGMSKDFVLRHYKNPNDIAPKVLRVKLLMNRLNWRTLQNKLLSIQSDIEAHLNNQLKLEFSVEITDFDASQIPWDATKDKEEFEINKDWLLENVHRKAIGYDIVCFHPEKEYWKRKSYGYALGTELIDGIQTILMTSKESGRRRKQDEFTSRFIHELCHTIVDMVGTQDTVHMFDYQDPTAWWKSLYKVRFEELQGWDAGGTRLFKWVNGKLKQKFVSNKQSSMYQSGIEYWLKAGGYKTTF